MQREVVTLRIDDEKEEVQRPMAENRIDGVYILFSSRRRHTRYWRDWSSDVCSSDLSSRSSSDAAADASGEAMLGALAKFSGTTIARPVAATSSSRRYSWPLPRTIALSLNSRATRSARRAYCWSGASMTTGSDPSTTGWSASSASFRSGRGSDGSASHAARALAYHCASYIAWRTRAT